MLKVNVFRYFSCMGQRGMNILVLFTSCCSDISSGWWEIKQILQIVLIPVKAVITLFTYDFFFLNTLQNNMSAASHCCCQIVQIISTFSLSRSRVWQRMDQNYFLGFWAEKKHGFPQWMLLFFGSIPNICIPVALHNRSKDVQEKTSFFIVFAIEKGCMCNF